VDLKRGLSGVPAGSKRPLIIMPAFTRAYVGLGDSGNGFHITREEIPRFFEHPRLSYWAVNWIGVQILINGSEEENTRFGDSQFYEFDYKKII
jgi:hypothetical protein